MKIAKSILAVALSLTMAVAFIGCQSKPDDGVAATVGGTEIKEADITALMDYYRLDSTTGSAMEDAAWATYIGNTEIPAEWLEFFQGKGYTETTFTPEILREYIIRNNRAVFVLMIQKAAEAGITADQASLDEQMESIKTAAGSEGTTLEQYIRDRGFANEASYRLMLEAYEISQPLAETLVADPSTAEVDEYIRTNINSYVGKRISLIALAVDEENPEADVRTKMESAKAKLDQGTDFASVAKETLPEGSQLLETGGDLGWGFESSMPTQVTEALNTLEKDQVSDIIEVTTDTAGTTDDPSDDEVTSLYIVKYTDEFNLPEAAAEGDGTETDAGVEAETDAAATETTGSDVAEETPNADLDLSTVPASLREEMTTAAKQAKVNEDQNAYWVGLAQSDEIVVNPMPEGLTYDVDMSLKTEQTTEDTTDPSTEALTPIDSDEAVSAAEAAGLQSTDTVVGSGAPAKEGDTVQVYYTGTFTNGESFDSNVGSGTPFDVVIGQSSVIEGWHQGLVGMKVGGKRTLTLPPSLAYGSNDYNGIPANSILIFEIELVSVNGDSTGYTGATAGQNSGATVLE